MKYFLPVFLLLFFSCNQEPISIYSNIDGLNHEEIINGPETLEKHSLELIYKIDTSLSKENFKLLIEALNKSYGQKIFKNPNIFFSFLLFFSM